MSKRFTDTDKYKKTFFRNLPGEYKLFWDYLYHNCNHAGIWHVDFEIAQIYLGKDMLVDKDKALELFNKDKERIQVLNDGTKWLIMPFVEFQYGTLSESNRMHKSVIDLLTKEGVTMPLCRGLGEAKDIYICKDKDKDKVKVKENKEKKKYLEHVYLTDKELSSLIEKYGKEVTKKWVKDLNNYLGINSKNRKKYESHYHVINSWISKEQKNENFEISKREQL